MYATNVMPSHDGPELLLALSLVSLGLLGVSCQPPTAADGAETKAAALRQSGAPPRTPLPRRNPTKLPAAPRAPAGPLELTRGSSATPDMNRDEVAWAALPLEGFEPAIVSLPRGGRNGAPLLVATHGAGGTAEWHCDHWRRLTQARGYILCLTGKRMVASREVESGYYYPDHLALGRELKAALASFRANYPSADSTNAVYAGYSQGASMGALAIAGLDPTFARAILVEGGFTEWSLSSARRFESGGGRRILFVCGRRSCADGARRSARWLRRAGIEVEAVLALGAGHTPAGAVEDKTAERLPWLLNGDPRWGLIAE